MIFTTGYDWLDLIYIVVVLAGTGLYVLKPLKEKTREEIKDSKRIVSYWFRYGRRGYETKGQKDFEARYWIWGFLVTFFLIILPWILISIGLLSPK